MALDVVPGRIWEFKDGHLSLKQTCPQTVWVSSAESTLHITVVLNLRFSVTRHCRICPEDPTHTAGRRAMHGACYLVSSSECCLELRALGRAYAPVLYELAPLWAWTLLGLPLVLSPPSLYLFLTLWESSIEPTGQSPFMPVQTSPGTQSPLCPLPSFHRAAGLVSLVSYGVGNSSFLSPQGVW